MAGIARNVVLHPAVTDGELAPAASAADEAGEQRIAVLGRAVMPARRDVLAHHPADRLRALPVDIAFVRAGPKRQPFHTRLATALRADARVAVLRHDTGSTIGIGATVDRVRHHPVDRRVAWSAPSDVAVVMPGGQIEPMLMEPGERLTGAAKFSHLVEDQADCILHPPVWVLLQPIAGFDEADRRGDDQLAPACLRVARGQRPLSQEIEFVLVQAALEPQEQSIIAVARLETGAHDAAGGGAAEIVIDDLDLGPAESRQTVAHGVLQRPALAIMQDPMARTSRPAIPASAPSLRHPGNSAERRRLLSRSPHGRGQTHPTQGCQG
jgi:hypothetical protein